jgi:hypothetical protein
VSLLDKLLKRVRMHGGDEVDAEAGRCPPQADTRSGTQQMGRFQRPYVTSCKGE